MLWFRIARYFLKIDLFGELPAATSPDGGNLHPTEDKVKKLFAATLHLSAQVACLQHQNQGLFKAIDLQKKKG